jgi:Asp-tRNA(Asn)/Glu-tRNA(Gln) amidotransferase A subunit family amidase
LPTINVPIGFNKDGLPLGMQIIGKKYEDLKILTFAKRYEQIFVHSKSKPKLN